MKKVVLTGGYGFIGSHIVARLLQEGYRVYIIDNLVTGKKCNLNEYGDRFEFIQADVSNVEVIEVINRINPDYIIHQAAQASVTESVKDFLYDEQVNIKGSLNVLQAALDSKVDKFVFASTAAVYGNPDYLPVDLEHKTNPESPYGLSKLTFEKYLEISSKLKGLEYTILRYGNVYGPKQDAKGEGGVIAIFIDKMLGDEHPIIFGDGEQSRDFVYVKDVADANVKALTAGSNETLNISSGTSITINELVEKLSSITGNSLTPIYNDERTGDIKHSRLSNTKTKDILSWRPETTIDEGLRQTVNYYLSNRN